MRLNDARVDPRGSLWIGSMRNNVNPDGSSSEVGGKDGALFRLDPDAKRISVATRHRNCEYPCLESGPAAFLFRRHPRQRDLAIRLRRGERAQSRMNGLSCRASTGACPMDRRSTRKDISGTAGSLAAVSFALRPMERLIASSKCRYRTLRPARLADRIARRFRHHGESRGARGRSTGWRVVCHSDGNRRPG